MRPAALKAALAAVLLLSTATPAVVLAQTTPPPILTPAQQKAADKQEAKDRKVVERALRVTSLAQLEPMVPELQKVVANAPARWPMIDHQPGLTTIRLNDTSAAMVVMLAVAASAKGQAGSEAGKAVVVTNTYGTAAFLLGSLAVEKRQPEEALLWLERGLAFQPDNQLLVTEKGSAMILQHRFAEAIAFYDAQPPIDLLAGLANPDAEARILRSRGFCLTELNRLDEAEAAYVKSLELEPDHGGAKAELDYIRKLKAGGAKQQVDVYTGQQAKDRKD
jgi:tetratricopeptide (TPR) repeat protein